MRWRSDAHSPQGREVVGKSSFARNSSRNPRNLRGHSLIERGAVAQTARRPVSSWERSSFTLHLSRTSGAGILNKSCLKLTQTAPVSIMTDLHLTVRVNRPGLFSEECSAVTRTARRRVNSRELLGLKSRFSLINEVTCVNMAGQTGFVMDHRLD